MDYGTQYNTQEAHNLDPPQNHSYPCQRQVDEHGHDTGRLTGRGGEGGSSGGSRLCHVRAIFDGANDTDDEISAALE